MKIGIIGTGTIGTPLARKLSAAGHEVRVANSRGVDGVRQFADEIGAKAADVHGAVHEADVIILSIPFPAVQALPKDLFDSVADDAIIIDTGNYYPDVRDPHIEEIDQGMVESVWVSKQIGRPVIKAFNNILSDSLAELGQPKGAPDRLAIAVAGDDLRAKEVVMELVDQIGFDPVNAGSLADSWRQQPSTPAYCCDYDAETMQQKLTAAVPGVAPTIRNKMMELFAKLGENPNHADIIAANRATNIA